MLQVRMVNIGERSLNNWPSLVIRRFHEGHIIKHVAVNPQQRYVIGIFHVVVIVWLPET